MLDRCRSPRAAISDRSAAASVLLPMPYIHLVSVGISMGCAESEAQQRAVVGSSVPLVARALAQLCTDAGLLVDVAHSNAATAWAAVLDAPPMVAVLDFACGNPSGIQMLRDIRTKQLPTRVVLLCAEADSPEPVDAIELGVDGLVLGSAPVETIAQCIGLVAAGEQWLEPRAMRAAYDTLYQRQTQPTSLLTRRESDVARLVVAGQRNRSISENLGISEGTVKMHLHNVYVKLGVESRTQLAMDTRLAAIA